MPGLFFRKYATTLDATTAGSIKVRLSIRKAGSADFAAGGDWTPATGDVKVSIDGGAQANVGTLPAYSNGAWEFVLSNTELTGKSVNVNVVDSATKAVDDDGFIVETFGNASAMYPTIFSGGTAGNPFTSGTGADQIGVDGAGNANANLKQWLSSAPLALSSGYPQVDVERWKTATPNALVTGRVDSSVGAMAAAAVQAIWDALTSALTTAGSVGKRIADFLTGDAYVRLGAPAGASLSADVAAVQTAVNNINNLSALANVFGPGQLEIPESGSIAYPLTFVVKDAEGHLLNLSGTPTITAANGAGTDRSANLSAVSNPSTGVYTFTYTVGTSHVEEGISVKATGTASSDSTTRLAYLSFAVTNADTLTTLTAIKGQTDKIGTTAADSSNVTGIKAKTDKLTFTGANFLEVDLQTVLGLAPNPLLPNGNFPSNFIDATHTVTSRVDDQTFNLSGLDATQPGECLLVWDYTSNAEHQAMPAVVINQGGQVKLAAAWPNSLANGDHLIVEWTGASLAVDTALRAKLSVADETLLADFAANMIGHGGTAKLSAGILSNAPAGGGGGSTVNEDNDVTEETTIVS